ncbi:MAG: hypothetical protein OXC67_04880 [Flavobacteriaceae bacterium]|nr:hypothetical protein [Flavobacteriaceae bacterium]
MKRGFVYDRHSDLDLILKKEKSKALKSLKTASLRQARLINSIFEAPLHTYREIANSIEFMKTKARIEDKRKRKKISKCMWCH